MKTENRDRLARWANRILFFLNAILCVVFLAFFSSRSLKPSTEIEYKDLIVILLTAIAVLLAAVTLFVGVIAIFGYSTIRDQASRLAVATAKKTATDTEAAKAARESEEQDAQKGVGQPSDALVNALQGKSGKNEDASAIPS